MEFTGLDLTAWISVYLGISLLRTRTIGVQADSGPADPRKKLALLGYGLLFLGLVIFLIALRHH